MDVRSLITQQLITLRLRSEEKKAAIEELSSILMENGYLTDLETYLQDVFKREDLSTTGIGFGVAIPHAKSTAVNRPVLAFGRSMSGIEWNSLDGRPVHLVFLIAVPAESAENEHLKILSALSRKLIHEDFRRSLREAQDESQILAALTGI
ncbi:PTS sugar transporter subunit IIA [Desulfofundulus salinus]|uniref:PTS mannose transporter subunit IIAB n=1 Tax=Desulfofundulus salinus TaxID=2419843 RepID=A0A494WRH3_9FIRM|nr:fructose PTS transporter subunit IIA [Desulfofundulus salinum]RKO65796.1 PTS mannose transporter subunit IIAB [Desulfofundulus salinum]